MGNQTIETERYIDLVRHLGIEEAYKQRFRHTGRTTRDILRLAHLLSDGQVVHIYTDNRPGKQRDFAIAVLQRVMDVGNLLGIPMATHLCRTELSCPVSGGLIRVFQAGANERGMRPEKTMEYVLHDC